MPPLSGFSRLRSINVRKKDKGGSLESKGRDRPARNDQDLLDTG
jgi:hypothetical protein